MRKTLIFSSLLAVFLIMMLPAVSAEESKVTQSVRTSPYFLNVQEAYMKAIGAKYADDPSPQPIFLTLAILLLKLLRAGMILIDAVILLIILKILGFGQNNTTGI